MHLPVLLLALLSALPSPLEAATSTACNRDLISADVYRVLDCEQVDEFLPTPAPLASADADGDDESDARRRAVRAQHKQPTPDTPAVAATLPVSVPGLGHTRALRERPAPLVRFHKEAIPPARAQLPAPAPIH